MIEELGEEEALEGMRAGFATLNTCIEEQISRWWSTYKRKRLKLVSDMIAGKPPSEPKSRKRKQQEPNSVCNHVVCFPYYVKGYYRASNQETSQMWPMW